MSIPDMKLMSYQIYNEVMRDLPSNYTEGDSIEYTGTEDSSILDITPLAIDQLKSKQDYSLKYSQKSQKSQESYKSEDLQTGIRLQNIENQNLQQQLASLREETELLKINLEKIRTKKNGYQQLHKTIETLESQLDSVQKQLLLRDETIKNFQNKQLRLNQQLSISQFRIRELQNQLCMYESDILQLHERILDFNSRQNISSKQKQLQLAHQQALEEQYLYRNKQIIEEVIILRREKEILKDQLEKQHKLIIKYEKKSPETRDPFLQLCQSRFLPKNQSQLADQFNELRKQLVEMMKSMTKQLDEVKNKVSVNICKIAKQCSFKIITVEQNSVQKQKINEQIIQSLKKQVRQLKMQLVESQICRQSRAESRTDSKPQMATCRTSINSVHSLFSNDQPTRLLKRQIMNSGKHINVIVNQNKVLKQVQFQRNLGKQPLFKSNKKK